MENKLTLEEFGQSVKIKYPEYRGMSDKEIGEATLTKFPEYNDRIKPETGFIADLKGIGTGIKKSFNDAVSSVDESQEAQAKGEQSGLKTLGHTVGQTAGFVSDTIGETVIGALKALTPQKAQEAIGSGVESVAQGVAETQPAQDMVAWYSELEPEAQRDIDASLGVLGLALDVAGGAIIKNPLKAGVTQTIDKTVDVTKQAVKTVDDVVAPAIDATKNVTKPVTDVITDIPRRLQTNLNTARTTREAVEALPTELAKVAVRDGIDINHVRQIFKITDPPTQAKFRELTEVVKKFEKDHSGTNPIELVGKPTVTRLKDLDSRMTTVGKELEEISGTLGYVTTDELAPAVMKKLNDVQGLRGLKMGDDGLLDFADTTLASNLSKADQKAIQEIFEEATTAGTGKAKHLLRQELFEILNGKKASLQNMTGTQEKAFNAVRQGLSDVLDTKNSAYKAKNMEYAKLVTPMTEMRKMMKQLYPDIDEDILDMSAGLLARRLTSNSLTNPKIRLILRQLDEATAVKGKTTLSVEALQDFYNILERYYDIAEKTGFQGQITSAIEKGGIANFISDTAKKFGGRSDAVRQKALEDLILEAYGQ